MRARVRALRLAVLLTGLLVTGARLAGQTVSAGAVLGAVKNSVRLSGVTDQVGGLSAGLAVDLEFGRFVISGGGTRGQLAPAEAGTAPDLDIGEASLGGRYDVRPWLGFELRYTARAFSSAAGRQRWDMVGVGVAASRELGTPAVRAFASLSYLPLVELSGQEDPDFGFASQVGLSLAPDGFPIAFMLGYRVERFDFPDAAARSEQFEAFTLSAGVHLRRLDGRWTLGGRRK